MVSPRTDPLQRHRRPLRHRRTPAQQVRVLLTGLLLVLGHFAEVPLYDPVLPEPRTILFLAGLGLSATIAGILSVYAYRATPASVLAPLQYLEIVTACIVAYWVFGDFPNAPKWAGIVVIIGSGLFIIWREDRPSASGDA